MKKLNLIRTKLKRKLFNALALAFVLILTSSSLTMVPTVNAQDNGPSKEGESKSSEADGANTTGMQHTIGFGEAHIGDPLQNQFKDQGIIFNSPRVQNYSGFSTYSTTSSSGTKGIEQCGSQEGFCNTPFIMNFTSPQYSVQLVMSFVGSSSEKRTVVLRAFNLEGVEVAKSSALITNSGSEIPLTACTKCSVNDLHAEIHSVSVAFENPDDDMRGLFVRQVVIGAVGSGVPNYLVLPSAIRHAVECIGIPSPTVRLTSPNGDVVRMNEFRLAGTITTTTPITSIRVSATLETPASDGVRPTETSYYDLLQQHPNISQGSFDVAISNLLPEPISEEDRVVISLIVTDQCSSGTAEGFVRYYPAGNPEETYSPGARIKVLGMEVNQSIQNLHNSVPLISGKPTIVRVYLQLDDPAISRVGPVSGILTAYRAGAAHSSHVCSSHVSCHQEIYYDVGPALDRISSINSIFMNNSFYNIICVPQLAGISGVNLPRYWPAYERTSQGLCPPLTGVLDSAGNPHNIPVRLSQLGPTTNYAAMRYFINRSLNFEIPLEWTRTGSPILLKFEVSAPAGLSRLPCEGCTNTKWFQFNPAGRLHLRVVDIVYPSNHMWMSPEPSSYDRFVSYLTRLFPVSAVDAHHHTMQFQMYDYPIVDYDSEGAPVYGPARPIDGPPISAGAAFPGRWTANGFLMSSISQSGIRVGDHDRVYGVVQGGFHAGTAVCPAPIDAFSCHFASGGTEGIAQDDGKALSDISHELGHTLGRWHAPGCPITDNGGPVDLAWPGDPYGRIGGIDPNDIYVGYDSGDLSLGIRPRILTSYNYYDLMTYCSPTWITQNAYREIMGRLNADDGIPNPNSNPTVILPARLDLHSASPALMSIESPSFALSSVSELIPSEGKVSSYNSSFTNDSELLVEGTIDLASDEVYLASLWRLPYSAGPSEATNSSYSIVLLDGGGSILARYPLNYHHLHIHPTNSSEADTTQSNTVAFHQVFPYIEGTRQVAVYKDETVLASGKVAGKSPTLEITPISDNDLKDNHVTISWNVFDANGTIMTGSNDTLTYTLLYSGDSGKNWQPLAANFHGNSYDVDLGYLPGSNAALFRVLASDGQNTAIADSPESFRVPFKAPEVRIVAPAEKDELTSQSNVVFVGAVYDPQNGINLDEKMMMWTSDIQGVLGYGNSISFSGLKPGKHNITFRVTNSVGLEAEASVQLVISAHPPFAIAGISQNSSTGGIVNLNGEGSLGTGKLSYYWEILSAPAASKAYLNNSMESKSNFVPDADGNYVIRLTVQDDSGSGSTSTTEITSSSSNSG